MSSPEIELLKLRLGQLLKWAGASTLHKFIFGIGLFVLIMVTATISILITMLFLNINPTLIVSVIGAPLWVMVILAVYHITKAILK